jgi:hypothetical protein
VTLIGEKREREGLSILFTPPDHQKTERELRTYQLKITVCQWKGGQ